jgi:hypothetical protein
MPKGSSIRGKSSVARKKSSMPKIILQDVSSVCPLGGEVRAKECEPGVDKAQQLFNIFNACFLP